MDETTGNKASAAADTSTVTLPSSAHPDSAIFEDIDDLSPITAVKASHAITGFPGFSSPIVFASPDLNPSGGSYSKRFQCHSFSKDICQQDSIEKKTDCCSDDTTKTEIQSSSLLINFTRKECDNGSKEDHFFSPPACVDKYLVDDVEVDHEKTKHSARYDLKLLDQCSDLKIKSAINKSVIQDGDEAIVTFPGILQLGEQDSQENASCNEKPVGKDANNEGNELRFSLKDQRSEHKDISDVVSEFQVQPINYILGYKDGSDATGEASSEKYNNEGQGGRGLQRRRLLFEEADRHVAANTLTLWNPANTETRKSVASLLNLEVQEPTVSQRTKTYSNTENSNQPMSTISFKRCSNSKPTVSKPSGIGLHLNSIISSKPKRVNVGIMITSDDQGCRDDHGGMFVSCSGSPHESANNGPISLKIGVNFSTTSQNEEASDSHCPEYEPLNDSALLMQRDYQTTLCGKRKFTLEQACGFEEGSHSSSKKKSRKEANRDGDGCKRCNCKKTKCLKLYCDCFAAGVYCSELCSCQGCFNRPDYVDTVLQVRQQIESRNPLAFAPKVVERLTGSHDSNMRAVIDTTPPSARHKRGCNCKKSMCMKKYCECYQNNVGCSSGCRCEGCQNVYGKKEDFHLAKDTYALPISVRCNENVEMVAHQDSFMQNEPDIHHSGTPITPSFQLSNHGKEGSKSEFSAARFVSSPEPDHSLILNYQEKGIVSSHPGLDCDDADTYNGLAEVDNSSRLLKSQEQLSIKSDYFSSFSSHERCKSSFTTPNGQFGSAKLFKTNSEENFDKILEDDTPEILKDDPTNAVKISSPNKKRVSPPRINSVKISSPNKKRVSPPRINSVKISSPNKKRVSPPRIPCFRKLSSFSSAGLKSGRKFILRGLPSFPPITPCVDGKDSNNRSNKS